MKFMIRTFAAISAQNSSFLRANMLLQAYAQERNKRSGRRGSALMNVLHYAWPVASWQ